MGLSELLSTLEHEAREEAARLDDGARREAEDIVDGARAEAERMIAEAVAESEDDARREAEAMDARARLERDAQLREAREAAIEQMLEDAREELAGLHRQDAWGGVLEALLDEALAASPSATRVRVRPEDTQRIRAALTAREREMQVDADLEGWGGVELSDDAGVIVRNTLEERLDSASERVRDALTSMLSAEGEPG